MPAVFIKPFTGAGPVTTAQKSDITAVKAISHGLTVRASPFENSVFSVLSENAISTEDINRVITVAEVAEEAAEVRKYATR